jgi:hypothetical protein
MEAAYVMCIAIAVVVSSSIAPGEAIGQSSADRLADSQVETSMAGASAIH